jgi:hypothetical protein
MMKTPPRSTGAGYSGTPLAKKLGFAEGTVAYVTGAPADYADLVAPLPAGVQFATRASAKVTLAHVFATNASLLEKDLGTLRKSLPPTGAVWVSWPKKASKVPTDITEDRIRELALPLGFVDVKVCAVDATWSGLKLVVRKELRP